MKTGSDTPTGIYKIDENETWWNWGSRESYGPNHRLVLTPLSGEIVESGRLEIRMHGGRQETSDGTPNGKSLSELPPTDGCIRAYDADMKKLKELTDRLEADDPSEKPGVLVVTGESIQVTYRPVLNPGTVSTVVLDN